MPKSPKKPEEPEVDPERGDAILKRMLRTKRIRPVKAALRRWANA